MILGTVLLKLPLAPLRSLSRCLIQASRYASDSKVFSSRGLKSALRLESSAKPLSSFFSSSISSWSFSSDCAAKISKNDGETGLPTLIEVKVGLGMGGNVGSALSRTIFGIPNTGVGAGTSIVDGLFVGFLVGFLVGVTPGMIGGHTAVQMD